VTWQSARSCSPVRIEDAMRELLHVHRLEQARLLRAASFLRIRRSSALGRSFVPVPRPRRDLGEGRTPGRWRTAAMEEIRTSRADGARVDALLVAIARAPLEAWPAASSIARAGLEIDRGHASLAALGRAYVAERRLEDALEILVEALEQDPFEEVRLEVLEALAAAFDLAGDVEGCLAFREAALAAKGGDLGHAVSLLALALCAGDSERAERASARLHGLDLGVPGIRSRFEAALSDVRRRFVTPGLQAGRGSRDRDARIRQFLARNRGPESEVARLVLGS
jgi:tetratricopeptide (TPR) repeat protein